MAVVLNQDDQDKDNPENNQPKQVNSGVDSGNISPTSTASSASPENPAGTSSGRFTNITSYLKANQNFNPEGGGLAGKVASNLNSQGNSVSQNVANAVQNFNNQSQQQVQQVQQLAPVVQQAVQNPIAAANDTNILNQVGQVTNAQYTGPKSLADLQGDQSQAALQAKAQNFKTQVDQGQTENGRFNLLRTMFGKPSYSSGQQNLDNLLIQGQKDQLQKIQNTRKDAAQVNSNLQQGINQSQQQGQQATQQVNDLRNNAVSTLANAQSQRLSDIDAQVAAQQKAKQDLVNHYINGFNGTSTPLANADFANLGITSGTRTYGVNPLDYFQVNPQNATRENVVTPDQYAQMQALSKLSGQDLTSLGSPSVQPFNQNQFNFDRSGFQNAIGSSKAALLDQIRQNVMNNYSAQHPEDAQFAQNEGNSIADIIAGNNPNYDSVSKINSFLTGPDRASSYGAVNGMEDKVGNLLSQLLSQEDMNNNNVITKNPIG